MRVVHRNRQGERAGNSASVRLGSDWAEARERNASSAIWMATLTRQYPVEADLIFKDGPGTRIVINTDAPDRSLIYVKQIASRTALWQAQKREASRLVLITTQSESRSGEAYGVVGDKVG